MTESCAQLIVGGNEAMVAQAGDEGLEFLPELGQALFVAGQQPLVVLDNGELIGLDGGEGGAGSAQRDQPVGEGLATPFVPDVVGTGELDTFDEGHELPVGAIDLADHAAIGGGKIGVDGRHAAVSQGL